MSFLKKLFGKKRTVTPTVCASEPKVTYTPEIPDYSEGLEFKENEDGTLTLKGIGTCTDNNLVIPESADGRSVVEIGSLAFNKNRDITDVVIPDSVKKIGYSAFSYCDKLDTVSIGSGVSSIGKYAFSGCDISSVTVPDGVRIIDAYTFAECDSLFAVNLPATVGYIGECAFMYCDSLTEINFDGTVSEWRDVSKSPSWHKDVEGITVYCKDGSIDVDDDEYSIEDSFAEGDGEECEDADEE